MNEVESLVDTQKKSETQQGVSDSTQPEDLVTDLNRIGIGPRAASF